MSPEFLAYVGGTALPDWFNRDAVVDYFLGLLRVFSAGSGHFDEAMMRDALRRGIARTVKVASSQINHFVIDVGEPARDRLGEIAAPTLVIHGDLDPVFPLGHAEVLAQQIPGARRLVLERTGHELPLAAWDRVVPAMLEHTAERGHG